MIQEGVDKVVYCAWEVEENPGCLFVKKTKQKKKTVSLPSFWLPLSRRSMLVLYKVRQMDTVFVLKVKDVKTKKTKKCTYLKTFWAEIIFCRFFPVWLDICCKNYKSTPELLYSIEIFSKVQFRVWKVTRAPMRLFCVFLTWVLGGVVLYNKSHTWTSQTADVEVAGCKTEAGSKVWNQRI